MALFSLVAASFSFELTNFIESDDDTFITSPTTATISSKLVLKLRQAVAYNNNENDKAQSRMGIKSISENTFKTDPSENTMTLEKGDFAKIEDSKSGSLKRDDLSVIDSSRRVKSSLEKNEKNSPRNYSPVESQFSKASFMKNERLKSSDNYPAHSSISQLISKKRTSIHPDQIVLERHNVREEKKIHEISESNLVDSSSSRIKFNDFSSLRNLSKENLIKNKLAKSNTAISYAEVKSSSLSFVKNTKPKENKASVKRSITIGKEISSITPMSSLDEISSKAQDDGCNYCIGICVKSSSDKASVGKSCIEKRQYFKALTFEKEDPSTKLLLHRDERQMPPTTIAQRTKLSTPVFFHARLNERKRAKRFDNGMEVIESRSVRAIDFNSLGIRKRRWPVPRDKENLTKIIAGLDNNWPVKHNAIVEGDLILGGLMMVHEREDTVTCGPIMPQGGIQALEAMLYTLDKLNDADIVPGVKIGAHILDDCDKDTYGL